MIKIKSNCCDDTEKIGRAIANSLNGTEVIALYGELGAGKTALVRGITYGMGVTDGVSSPTFAIINEYVGKYRIYHFDMYRVLSYEDLHSTGFFNYVGNGIVLIEWSENINDELRDLKPIKIKLEYGQVESERLLTIEGMDDL